MVKARTYTATASGFQILLKRAFSNSSPKKNHSAPYISVTIKAKRKGFPTAYALQQGLLENENGTGMWWIASYNHHPYRVDYISRGGGINEYGARAHDNWVGVRPAVRVKWKVSD